MPIIYSFLEVRCSLCNPINQLGNRLCNLGFLNVFLSKLYKRLFLELFYSVGTSSYFIQKELSLFFFCDVLVLLILIICLYLILNDTSFHFS